MDWLLLTVVAAVFFLAVVALNARLAPPEEFPYQKKDPLFSAAEQAFLGVLQQAVGNDYAVMGKVRVADVIKPKRGLSRSSWQSAFNRISAKHVDFVLCDPESFDVECIIELNDRSHKRAHRAKRDAFLRSACEAAGIRLIEVQAQGAYSTTEIKDLIHRVDV